MALAHSSDITSSDSLPAVSFEFFPPRSLASTTQLRDAADRLRQFSPRFVSVTYGAGGSTREKTLETLVDLRRRTGLRVAGHLTCAGATRANVDEVSDAYWRAGVRHVVALRGDPPDGQDAFTAHPEGYRSAAELVSSLKQRADFEISVAAYPETHPDAKSPQSDLDNLKRKLDAGADRAITQFCFDPERILRFVDSARAAGVNSPIVAGILPIVNFERAIEFAKRCGAAVPGWLGRLFMERGQESSNRESLSASIAIEQCRFLQRHGIDEFHFYTLNRAELTNAICRSLAATPSESVARFELGGAVGLGATN